MKRYFYNVDTFVKTLDAIRYNRTHDDQKQVNVVPVFEITESTNMESFSRDVVTNSWGEDSFATIEDAQEAMNRCVEACLEDY